MPEQSMKLLLIATCPYSAMFDTCAVITALMKLSEKDFQLIVVHSKFNLLWPMILVFNGLEMSLNNILRLSMFLSNNGVVIFLEQKKYLYHSQKINSILITGGSNIFSIRPDAFSLKVKIFFKINFKFILADNGYMELVNGD